MSIDTMLTPVRSEKTTKQEVPDDIFEAAPPSDVKTYHVANSSIKTSSGRSSSSTLFTKREVEQLPSLPSQKCLREFEANVNNDPNYALILDAVSNAVGRRVTPIEMGTLMGALLRLLVLIRFQEKWARLEERQFQEEEMEKICTNFKTQGQWQLFSSVISGVASMAAGLSIPIGVMKGTEIRDFIGDNFFSKIKAMDPKELFKSFRLMANTTAETQKATGQIQYTFAEGDRTRAQHLSDLARTDGEECTRSLDATLQDWRSIESFLTHYLQMEQETVRALYS